MESYRIYISYMTILRKEVRRFMRIWQQTLLPSAITTVLYYTIFGTFIGSKIQNMGGFSYIQFIVPGLVMLGVITNSFSNVVGSFYSQKFQKNLDELLVSPTPPWIIIAGFVSGGILRGVLVGLSTLGIALFFTKLTVFNLGIVLIFMLFTATIFSLAGLMNGVFAKTFDHINIVPVFVLTPLVYLGGVFYSINALPPVWRIVSLGNPLLYLINGFRYGFLGVTDVSVVGSLALLVVITIALGCSTLYLFQKGIGLKN